METTLPTREQALAALTAPGQTYELTSHQLAGRSLRVFHNAPVSLRQLFADTVSDQTFIVYGDERLSFAQAYRRASVIGRLLVDEYRVVPGDRVAISMRNYPEWILAFCAITSIGAVAVAMNALWLPDEMDYALSNSGAKVLFADQERLDRYASLAGKLPLDVIGVRATRLPAGARSLETLMDGLGGERDRGAGPAAGPAMPAVNVAPDDNATIFYTSGSTGHPKGVVASHRSILSALLSWELDGTAAALMAGITTPPVLPYQGATLLAVPLFHATGSHAVYLMCYRLQRKLVSMYKWDPALAAELIEREQITSFIAPAAMTGDLVREAQRTKRNLGTLVAVGGGGAPRAPEQVKQIGQSFGQVVPATGWGMTETNAIGTGIGGLDYLTRPASSGRCSAVMELKVVDDAGNRLPAGQRGELLVRGTAMFAGYWNRPDLEAGLFEDGWFRTGDIAQYDDEGYWYIVDRAKDLIIRGGENIGCGQVEAALVMHPGIHEAAVYAVPDERLGEEVGATVFGEPGLDADQIREFLGAHLARFEVPRYIRIADAPLPRTASGKILKRQIRDDAVAVLAPASSSDNSTGRSAA